jgi:hypothetical protein
MGLDVKQATMAVGAAAARKEPSPQSCTPDFCNISKDILGNTSNPESNAARSKYGPRSGVKLKSTYGMVAASEESQRWRLPFELYNILWNRTFEGDIVRDVKACIRPHY